MVMKRTVIGLLAAVVAAAPTIAAPPIVADKIETGRANQVVDMLFVACPKLANAQRDIDEIAVKALDEYAEHRLALGWAQNIHITVRLVNDVRSLPAWQEGVGPVGGQTLHYDVGGGIWPGIIGSKRVSQWLCDIPIVDGRDSFRVVPEFGTIDF
jgi:hypothetical protein